MYGIDVIQQPKQMNRAELQPPKLVTDISTMYDFTPYDHFIGNSQETQHCKRELCYVTSVY